MGAITHEIEQVCGQVRERDRILLEELLAKVLPLAAPGGQVRRVGVAELLLHDLAEDLGAARDVAVVSTPADACTNLEPQQEQNVATERTQVCCVLGVPQRDLSQ